jgi:hypothetical protein
MQSRNRNWLLPAIALSGAVVAGSAIQRTGTSHPVIAPVGPQSASGATSTSLTPQRLQTLSSKLQLGFEPNQGQARPGVNFVARGRGYSLYLTPGEAELVLPTAAPALKHKSASAKAGESRPLTSRRVQIALKGANPAAVGRAMDELPGKTNYILGGDESKWRKDVPSYAKVQYDAVYPGVDLVYYGTQGRLEYDFLVQPGGKPETMALTIKGADQVHLDAAGDLVLATGDSEIRQGRPVAYQEIAGVRQAVDASYELRADHSVGFRIGEYDHSQPLVVDPYVSYATYLGKSGTDEPWVMAVDSTGIYVAGATGTAWFTSANTTTDYPSYKTTYSSSYDIFLTKLSLDGQKIIYSTFYGGAGDDRCRGIAVDAAQNVYFTGETSGGTGNFPAVNAWQTGTAGGYDAYVVKLGSTGNTVAFSSWLGGGGNDAAYGIALDASGNAYVTGMTRSTNMFPAGIMTGVAQPTSGGDIDMFIAKIASAGGTSGRLLATYLGGGAAEVGNAIAVDSAGYIYAVADSQSPGNTSVPFPTTSGAYQTTSKGSTDVALVKLNADFTFSTSGGRTPFSTYFGGGQVDSALALKVDANSNIYIAGTTNSINPTPSLPLQQPFPTTASAYQPTVQGGGDAFVSKFDSNGGLLYSSYFGAANNQDYAQSLAVNDTGKVWIAGFTKSTTGFPVRNAIPNQTTYRGGNSDGFIARFDTTLSGNSSLLSSSFYGGSAADEIHALVPLGPDCDTVYIYGITTSATLLPVVNPFQAAKATALSDADGFIAKIDETPPPVADAGADRQVECPGGSSVTLQGSITSGGMAPFTYLWTEGATVVATTLTPTVSLATGVHTLKLKVTDSCYSFSTDTVIITVSDTTPPTITYTPSNVSRPNDLGECFATYNPGTITATEACSTATITAVASPGNLTITPNASRQWMIDPGADADGVPGTTTYTITWTAKDAANNSSTSISTITVSDTEAPVFTVPPTTISTPATPGAPGTFVNPGTPTATDNCTLIALVGFRDNPGLPDTGTPADLQGQYPLGTSIITWIAIDEAYNFTEAYQTVTVTGELSILSNFDSTSFGPSRTFTADVASDVLTSSGHGFKAGNPVRVTTSGTLPGGLAAATTYYVISPTAVSFKLSATLNGAAVNITSTGSGTNQAAQVLNDGTDGWTSTGGTFSYQAAGGNTIGHVRGSDASATSTLWYFRAPAKFRGNRYASSAVELSFDLRRNTGTSIAGGEDVILTGGGLNIYATLPSTPPAGSWQSYALAVNTSVGWKVKPGGGTATANQIRQVLESLQEVKIRGKWNSTASAEGDVDNVKLKLTY